MAPRVIVGNFDGLEFDSTEAFLSELRRSIHSLESAVVNPFLDTNTRLDLVLSRARDVDTRITLGVRTDFVRKQPFGILVAGPPGSGKTFGSQNLAIRLYNLNHEKPATKQDIVVLNEGDEFQSEFRSCHRIVLFDDLGATKTSVVAADPFRKIIDFINNVPKTALNPHLDLKGNVWINPDIVVATTNLFIPFSQGNNVNNTEAIQCVAAINRRFPVKIWQQGFDEFYIVDNHDTQMGYKRDDGSHYKFHYTRLNSEQLYERVKEIYLEHCESQEKFVEMVEDQVRPEGLYGTALKFAAITSLQAIARLTISLEARDGDEGLAALLVALRRFVATPLQALKRSSQAELTTRLIAAGLSKGDTHRYKSTLEKLCKFGPVLYRAHVTEQDLLELRVVIDMIAPVIEQVALKTVVRPLPYELGSIVYDILSLLFPKVTKLIMEKVPSVTLKSLQLTKSVSAEGELRSKTLRKIYDLDWILAVLDLYEIKQFDTIELYVGSFILNGYRAFSKSTQPIRLSDYGDLRPCGACLTEKEFRQLVESDESVKPEGASGPCTVQLSVDETKEPLEVNVLKNDYRLLLPVRTVVDPRQVVADYLARRIDLPSMMLRMGAARRKNLLILRRVDYVNQQFLQGIYTLAYDEVHSTLLIFRTVKKTYKVNLSYWFGLLKFAARENSVVFCGRNENVTLVTPLFSDKFCPVEEALDTVLSVNELCIDIMGRSARRKNESQFLVGKATRGEDSKPLPNMMEDERRRLAKLYGTEWTS